MPLNVQRLYPLAVKIALAIFCMSVASDVNAQTPPSGDTGLGCIAEYSGSDYVTFNWYNYSQVMSVGSNNFETANSALWRKNAASSTWENYANFSITFDNRFAPVRSADGCTDHPAGGGWFNLLYDTTNFPYDGYYVSVITTSYSTTTFYYLKQGSSIIPILSPDNPTIASYEFEYGTQYNTRFSNVQFLSASTSVDFNVGYFIDSTEATTTQADRNPSLIRARYSKVPSTTFSAIASPTSVTPPSWGNGTTTLSLDLDANSTYDVQLSFANPGTAITGVVPFPLAYVYFTVTTDSNGGIATTSSTEFYDALEEQAFQYQPCSITEISGCITNAFTYLFTPSNATLDQFASLEDELATRAPFVYFYQVPDYWDTLFNSSQTESLSVSASTSIGDITFISEAQLDAIPLTNVIRTIIGYLLWVMLAFTVYARVRSLFNRQTTV